MAETNSMPTIKQLIAQFDQRFNQGAPDCSNVSEILGEYSRAVATLTDSSEEIGDVLSSVVRNDGDMRRLDLLLIAAWIHPSPAYIENLCELLTREDPRFLHENIVDLLYKIPNPTSVPYLQKACRRTFSWDMHDGFGVKCLDALAAIATPEAWAVIVSIDGSFPQRMQERAQELIEWRKSG